LSRATDGDKGENGRRDSFIVIRKVLALKDPTSLKTTRGVISPVEAGGCYLSLSREEVT
jgi:hypothetical protein